ncbi:MAG TPA: hypothetical protein VLS53_00120 [Candidatus Dormibacteraeota bacterium]|nr:hypothetical protein [Candidatus Dormibacteraeota bacterium]
MHVAIYADKDPGGKKLIATIQRRLKNEEIRAWQVKNKAPFTLIHSGDRYTKIKVTFVPAGTASFTRAARAGLLGAFRTPEPALLASISVGPSSDRVLGFLVGMLTRHAGPLGVTGVGIPLVNTGK